MNHKPDKPTLMAYVYHELEEEKARWVEAYLQEHPEEKAELEALSEVHHLMEKFEDEEVPPLILPDRLTRKSNPHTSRKLWVWTGSVAACLALLIVFVSWIGLQVQYSNQTLTLQLGKGTPPTVVQKQQEPSIDYQQLIHQTVRQELDVYKDSLSGALSQVQHLQTTLQRQTDQAKQQDTAIRKALTRLVQSYQKENNRLVSEIIHQANRQQQQYTDELLAQFLHLTAQQRTEDLQLIKDALLHIQQNTAEKQEQTDYLLTQLYTQLNEPTDDEK